MKKILIYQYSLGIRAWKCGYILSTIGYSVEYCYTDQYFDKNYIGLSYDFIKASHILNIIEEYDKFLEIYENSTDLIVINAWENAAVKLLPLNPIYYIGDMQILQYKGLSGNLFNGLVINERNILANSKRLLITNNFMVDRLKKEPFNINIQDYCIVRNSQFFDKPFVPQIRDYRDKCHFNLVYVGSISFWNNHRKLIPLFKKMVKKFQFISIDLYTTIINCENIEKSLVGYDRIKLRGSLGFNNIIDTIKEYDFGLNYFNLNYDDAEYIEIAEPNKYFDYYFANLPMIANSTDAFVKLISDTNFGICINNINELKLELLQQRFYTDNTVHINDYKTELLNGLKMKNIFNRI